jgi:hypothetical protein
LSASVQWNRLESLLDSDALGDELVGEYSDHGDLSALGHRVVEKRWGSGVCDCLSVVSRGNVI